MGISFDSEQKIFKLDTKGSSYIFEIFEEGYLLHLYYGKRIPDANVKKLAYRGKFSSFCPLNAKVSDRDFSPALAPMEYSCSGAGDFRIPALQVKNINGDSVTDVRYLSHRIYAGKPGLEGLPALYAMEDEAQTLEVDTIDRLTGCKVTLVYTVFENYDAMTRSVRVENTGEKAIELERVFSACVEFPDMDYDMLHLYGQWFKERSEAVRKLEHGIQSIGSRFGSSGHCHNPFAALKRTGSTEDFGEVYGFNLVYSGNFSIEVEVDPMETSRLLAGINPVDFSWRLEPGESFVSPELVMVYSDGGLGKMSRTFHRLYMNCLIRGKWRDIKRPVLINSWEAAFFDFDEQKLAEFARKASELGIEMLVMDDGWFGRRDDDTSSLGDWFVNENKLKGGLSHLIEQVNKAGLKFGIWYEPEMISPDSELYRAHPDYCLQAIGRDKSIARSQYVLDMSRKEVRDNIFEQMYKILSQNKIDYLKWDFNRYMTEVGSSALPPERQKETAHRFILGTYELMDRITKAFPDMLIENCSGGGGRFDPGMLYYSPQIWCSDNTDAIERLTIQFGTSMCYPVSTMGAHVSANPRTPFSTRGNVAMSGTFGYELDPGKLTEAERELVKKQIKQYNLYNNVIRHGDLFRLIDPNVNKFRCAWQFVSTDRKEALLTVVVMRKYETPTLIIRLKGLDEEKMYEDVSTGEIYSGALLMNAGINLTAGISNDPQSELSGDDGSSVMRYFRAI